MTAFGFCWNASPAANSLGYDKETASTLKADGRSIGVLRLNDQGRNVLDCHDNISGTLRAQEHGHPPLVMVEGTFQNTGQGWWNESEVAATLRTACGGDSTKANLVVMAHGPAVTAVDCRSAVENDAVNGTLQAHDGGISYNCNNVVRTGTVIRRLTPLECERLQGFPDGWTDIGPWVDSKGKWHKESNDTVRYTALGNSIALPFWLWLTKHMAKYLPAGATLGSLFDGIGGFPLCWETVHGKGTARWASEIEEFPITVTRRRVGKGWN